MLKRGSWGWLSGRRVLIAYAALVLLSHAVIAVRGPRPPAAEPTQGVTLDLPRMTDQGPVAGSSYELRVLNWEPAPGTPGRLPVVLLHGCPSGGGRDFASLGRLLAARGSRVIAPDLPSAGASGRDAPTYSILSSARVVLAAMDAMGVERAHVVGWSQGGGVALHMADLGPDRVASLTMLASIGTQETEGSGSAFFEHCKYRLGHVLLAWGPELLPHFGLLGSHAARATALRPFIDSDLRPMRALLQRLTTPTMILHGRHDFLVPAWAAEEHHELIAPSTLVMLDGDHFMPMGRAMPLGKPDKRDLQLAQCVAHLRAFFDEYEGPGPGAVRRGAAVFASPETHITQSLGGFKVSRDTPWWLVILIIGAAMMVSEDLTIITVGILMASQSIDWGVGLIGCFVAIVLGDFGLWLLGRTLGRRVLRLPFMNRVLSERGLQKWGQVLDRHTGKAVMLSRCLPGTRMPTFIAAGVLASRPWLFVFWVAVAAFVWAPFLLGLTVLLGPGLLDVFRKVFHGPWAIVAAVVVLYLIMRLVGYETTAMGRDRLKRDLRWWVTREFWPTWMFYIPFVPTFIWLGFRRGGPLVFTSANPGIPGGGGVLGESKAQVLAGLGKDEPMVAPWRLIPAGQDAQARARVALEALESDPRLGGLPIVLKPDNGFRGRGVKIARTKDDVRAYLGSMTAPAIMQRYDPGPEELGVLWARVPRAGAPVDEWAGEIISATHKDFPLAQGDGVRTLELLIWHHPRHRMQADIFIKRHEAHIDRVLGAGETFPLALAGNHCQGTMFSDGMVLVTPELAATIERIAQGFRDPATGRRIDFGRFDLRYKSHAALARGEGFSVVEFNGTSSESTSVYDPTKTLGWALGVLTRHWRRLFTIGRARAQEGIRPIGLGELVRLWREDRRRRPGPRLSD